ncbi:MAG: MBL fold metallo-hydrolase [Dehalococcoidia bacterium]|nr:MAG: MBL fold metallo-hydrolase [Dehalococcoidia bacterium]
MKRARVGNVEVVALVDCVESYDANSVYVDAVEAIAPLSGYLDSEGRVALNFGCFLLREGGRTILVDTGWGPEHHGLLPDELREAGVGLDEVDTVIFTHLHGDHTAWNLDRATGKPMFPRARYLVPRADWDHYSAAGSASFVRDVAPLERLGCLDLIEGERVLMPSITTLPTPGHTPGHTSIAIVSGGERGLILGDVVLSEVDAVLPDLLSTFDEDRELAQRTRRAILQRLLDDGSLVGASHIRAPGLGHFVREGTGTRWRPLA